MDRSHVGRYEVKDIIALGGMSAVYRAHDPRFGREVAIKMLPREYLDDPVFRARFEREARIIASLDHPAIVPVYDFGEEGGQLYLVMRLMTGGSLADRLRGGRLELAEVSRIVTRLAPALDEAHARGITHRDIKPGNILFDQRNDSYLADFGIVKMAKGASVLTGAAVVGTPAYMSPEQVTGQAIDGRSDIYSLGAIIFQCLTGLMPYQADSAVGLAMKHLNEPVPDVLQFRPDLPSACRTVIYRAMAKRPEDRYIAARYLADALGVIRSGQSPNAPLAADATRVASRLTVASPAIQPVAGPGALAAPPVSPGRRRWLGAAALVLLLLLCCAGAGFVATNFQSLGLPLAGLLGEATATPSPTATPTAAEATRPPEATPEPPSPTFTATPPPATATLTATATPTRTPTATPAATDTATPPDTPSPTATSRPAGAGTGSGLPLTFEVFGVWGRGNEPNGTLEQSTEQVHAGSFSARLSYDFPSTGNDYVVLLQNNDIPGQPVSLQVWVYGDGAGHYLNIWIQDAAGETWQVPMGRVTHTGWSQMSGRIEVGQPWPWTRISGPDNGQVDYPIRFRGFVLDDLNDSYTGQGAIYLDEVTAGP